MRVPIGVPRGGVGVGLMGVVGGGFPVENIREEGRGGGGLGVGGTGKETGKSMRKLCRNYPLGFSKLPFSFSQVRALVALNWRFRVGNRAILNRRIESCDSKVALSIGTIAAKIITCSHFCFGQD